MIFLKNKGIATLPTVIVLGIITLTVVVSITAISFTRLLISQNQSQSSRALFYAEGGARDALMKITRNKNYSCDTTDCYLLNFTTNGCISNTNCAKVSVSIGDGTTGNPKIITSKGIMKSSIRTIQVEVILDNGTSTANLQNGQITSTTWTELTN